jgi:activator of HSP90 ATPase
LVLCFNLYTCSLIGHSSDVYQGESAPQTPELVQRKPPQQNSTLNNSDKQDQSIRTTKLQHSYDFKGSTARDVYEALLDLNRASVWSQGKAKVSKRIGSDFEFFDGNVHGKLLEAVSRWKKRNRMDLFKICIKIPGQKIIQTWRLKGWPKGNKTFRKKVDVY